MSNPALNQFVGNDIENEKYSVEPQGIRNARGHFEAKPLAVFSMQEGTLIETHSRADIENMKPGMQDQVNCIGAAAILSEMVQANPGSARMVSSKARQRINCDSRFRKEHQARLLAEAKLRQLQIEFAVLAKRTEQAALDSSAAEYARLLALEAADRRALASKTARVEAERKLKAELDAAELIKSQAEADRNAWLLQEQDNVLLRKAEQKAQERLSTETMTSKATAFKLQTERNLAVIAEQLSYVELQIAHEVELRLRAETKELALANERLAIMQQARRLSGQNIDAETRSIAESAQVFNEHSSQALCEGEY